MKNIFKFAFIAYIFCLNLVFASEDYNKYTQNVPGLDAYPEASAINVYTDVKITVNSDKSYIYDVFYVKKILNYKGKKEYSDVKIEYDANFDSVEIGDCFTFNEKGEKKSIPKEALHNTENFMSVTSPDYINMREWVINFPEVEPGAFIFLNYKKICKRCDFIEGVEHLAEFNPYLNKKFTIISPITIPIYYDYKKDYSNLKFSKKTEGQNVVYSWDIEKTNCILEENDSPSLMIIGCPVAYSSAKDWQVMMSSEFKKLETGISVNNVIKKMTDSVIAGKSTPNEKLFAIYNFIANNFILKPIMLEYMDFTPQPLEKVIAQKYGSSRELTSLFISMAKAAGINNCEPAIALNENERFSELQLNVATRQSFRHLLAYFDGMLISVGSNDMPFGFSGLENCNIIVGGNKPKIEKYLFPKIALISKIVKIKILPDKDADIDFSSVYHGSDDYKLRQEFRNETEQNRKIWFSENIGEKNLTVTEGPFFDNIEDLIKPLTIRFTAEGKNFYSGQDNYIYFELPQVSLPITITAKERKNPLQIFEDFHATDEYVITNIPKGYSVVKPSSNIHEVLTLGSEKSSDKSNPNKVEYNVNFKEVNGQLILSREIIIPQMLVQVEDFHKIKDFITKIHSPLNMMIFLKKSS
jgi:hypothetical protein